MRNLGSCIKETGGQKAVVKNRDKSFCVLGVSSCCFEFKNEEDLNSVLSRGSRNFEANSWTW